MPLLGYRRACRMLAFIGGIIVVDDHLGGIVFSAILMPIITRTASDSTMITNVWLYSYRLPFGFIQFALRRSNKSQTSRTAPRPPAMRVTNRRAGSTVDAHRPRRRLNPLFHYWPVDEIIADISHIFRGIASFSSKSLKAISLFDCP